VDGTYEIAEFVGVCRQEQAWARATGLGCQVPCARDRDFGACVAPQLCDAHDHRHFLAYPTRHFGEFFDQVEHL
jgi:hypothetical protein